MLRSSETNHSIKICHLLYLTLFLFYMSVQISSTSSIDNENYNNTTAMLMNNATNDSADNNLYVIKTMVYEIGILTDADNTTNDTTERQEEVKLSFYKPPGDDDGI
ncbi:uncharacterized protein LOC143431563 [Xylocopa sonorina]|uniref:uncharacterized protein LOC143431563 n=1 Tax=Xylocopa sonorina TaxID=1818115 RepID=UPI00403B045D